MGCPLKNPDGLPIVDWGTKYENLLLAWGHNKFGKDWNAPGPAGNGASAGDCYPAVQLKGLTADQGHGAIRPTDFQH